MESAITLPAGLWAARFTGFFEECLEPLNFFAQVAHLAAIRRRGRYMCWLLAWAASEVFAKEGGQVFHRLAIFDEVFRCPMFDGVDRQGFVAAVR